MNNHILAINQLPKIGIVLEKPDFFNELSGLKNLEMLAKIRNEIHTDKIMEAIKKSRIVDTRK